MQPEPDKRGRGRPKHVPTDAQRKQVRSLAAYGVPTQDICTVIGICQHTLYKHYREELDKSFIEANARVAESLFRKAIGDGQASVTAAIFWMKTRAGWKETSIVENVGETKVTHTHEVTPEAAALISALISGIKPDAA